ncbi:hypothetical protein DV738_g513, partial [Chaetothyriales sp. CBS 135597]
MCQNAGVPELCTYEPSTKKRGLPEGYVRGLEKLYSVLMAKLDGFEEAVVGLLSDEKDDLTRVWNHQTYGDQLHQTWKESNILQHLEVILAASSLVSQVDRTLDVSYLYEVSRKCIPFTEGLYVLGHVQALILLVLADILSNRWSQAWYAIGLASRVIQDLVASAKILGKEETATYQACFILDTLIAFRLQRMPQLRRTQLPAYLVEDGHDEWEPVAAAGPVASSEPGFLLSTFNRVTDLFAILNDRICSPDGNSPTADLDRLALSHSYALPDNSPPASHKVALRAIHSTIAAYLTETGLPGTRVLHTLNVTSGWLKRFPDRTSSIIATATLETIRHKVRASSQTVSSSKHLPFDRTVNSLEPWPGDPFTAEALPFPSHRSTAATSGSQVDDRLPLAVNANNISNKPPAPVGMAFHHQASSLSHHDPVTAYNPSIATSPSFHSEEIDALFREMAHLDTTEWVDGRNQGLKDFGFADSMTFEAFCNDPDRVLPSYQQPNMPDQSSVDVGISSVLQEARPGAGFWAPDRY